MLQNESSPPFVAVAPNPDGIVAVGGDLSPTQLIKCYKNGIFPWFVERGTPFWFCPDPRLVLFPNEFKLSKSLAKSIKNFTFTINKDFVSVIKSCSKIKRKGQKGTWITKEYITNYSALHKLGNALSIEVWHNNELVGGLYGVYIAPIFFGESMFHTLPDASKAALWFLTSKSKELNISLIDCQQSTPHLISLGAEEIGKEKFLETLSNAYA